MATIYTGTVVRFDKVTGFTNGPLKPTKSSYTGNLSTIKSSLTAALDDLSNVGPGETLQIVVTAKEVET